MSIYVFLIISFLIMLIINIFTRLGTYLSVVCIELPKYAFIKNKTLLKFYIIKPPKPDTISISAYLLYLIYFIFFVILLILSILQLIFNLLSYETQSLIFEIWKIVVPISILLTIDADFIIYQINKHKTKCEKKK